MNYLDASQWNSWQHFTFNLIVLLGFASVTSGVIFTLTRWLKQSKRDLRWIRSLARSGNLPLQIMLWTLVALTLISQMLAALGLDQSAISGEVKGTLQSLTVVTTISWLAMRCKKEIESTLLNEHRSSIEQHIHRATVAAISRLISIGIISITLLMMLDLFGVPLSTLLAFGGAGAVASGLAAKDIIANFFGGFMIFVTRPFSIGDWINSPDKSIEGTVISIGWYMTCIRSFDKRPIYVPNAIFSSLVLVNPSRMTNRRILQTVGVRYCDIAKLPTIVAKTEKMLQAHPEIDQQQTLMVHLTQFGSYSLDFNIYTFTKTTDWKRWRAIQQDVLLRVAKIIAEEGAEIAFPTQDVHLHTSQDQPINLKK